MTVSNAEPSGALSASQQRFLAYWGVNATMTYSAGWSWIPGFPYSDEEKARLAAFAAAASGRRTALWLMFTALIGLAVIVVTALVGGFVLFAAFGLIWRNGAAIPLPALGAGFALIAGVAIAIDMPFAIGLGGALTDAIMGPLDASPDAMDAPLHAKLRRQFWRLPLIMIPLFVVAFVGFTLFLH